MRLAESKSKVQVMPIISQFFSRFKTYQREFVGGFLLMMTAIILLNLFSLTEGSWSQWWGQLFSQLFGWGAIPAVIFLGVLGGLLIFSRLKEEDYILPFDMIIGVELLFVASLSLTHLLVVEPGPAAVHLAQTGGGGGYVGWAISDFCVQFIGEAFSTFLFMVIGLVALGLLFRVNPGDAAGWAEMVSEWAARTSRNLQARAFAPREPDVELPTVPPVAEPPIIHHPQSPRLRLRSAPPPDYHRQRHHSADSPPTAAYRYSGPTHQRSGARGQRPLPGPNHRGNPAWLWHPRRGGGNQLWPHRHPIWPAAGHAGA
jgi:hypothetical protein